MSYDYSLKFLKDYAELVQKIIQIAATGEVLVYESDDWDSIKKRQRLVNNVLANMERNMPDYKDIRAKVRGWTAFKDESTYQLFIGIPVHKIAGRPPGQQADRGVVWKDRFVPASDAAGLKYTSPTILSSEEDWAEFVGKVYMLPEQYTEASIRTAEPMDPKAAEEFFGQPLEHKGWMVHLSRQEVTFKRTGT